MAASRDLRSRVTDVVTCPICLELSDNPKSLPCLHTFCLKCIAGHCRDNEPGDEVACPVCRQEFNIPESGVKGLVSNFFIADLVEARKTASDVNVQIPCEACLLESGNSDRNVAVSTRYCVDCNRKLCDRCSPRHSRRKKGSHNIVQIGSELSELSETQYGKCDKHKDDDIRLYCMDCEMNICVMCVADEHQQHKCNDVNVVAAEFVRQIEADLVRVEKRADIVRNEIRRSDEGKQEFRAGVEYIQYKLVGRGKELKQFIDAQVDELMLEVKSLTTETCKEIESLMDGVEMKLLKFETFRAYCRELKTKGKPCDITRAADDLHNRATELLQNDVTLQAFRAPSISFTPMNIWDLLGDGQNFVGKISTSGIADFGMILSSISFMTPREKTLEQQLAQSADTERSLRQQIAECHSEMADNDKMWTQKMNELQTQFKLLKQQETELKADKVKSEKRISELLTQCEQPSNSERVFMVKAENSEKIAKKLHEQIQLLEKDQCKLIGKLSSTEKTLHDLQRQCNCKELHKSNSELKSQLESSEESLKQHQIQYGQVRRKRNETRGNGSSDDAIKPLPVSESELCKLEKSENDSTESNPKLEQTGRTDKSLRVKVKLHDAKQLTERRHLMKHEQTEPCVVYTLRHAEHVIGVTSLDDKLYVLREKHNEQVAVYFTVSTTTTTCYSLINQLSLPGVEYNDLWDMTSCKHYRCLYIADCSSNCCVHRVQLNGKVTKLSVNNTPSGLSVTSQFTVLVTCCKASIILELTTEGKQLREICVRTDKIDNPQHAIQLSNGQFVVCHGWSDDSVHRVCIVDTNGHVTQSYGGARSSQTIGQLNGPCHLAVDKDEFIFVADSDNSRVVLLGPTLSFVREIVSRDQLKGKPWGLFLDADRRLYVSVDRRVVVVQL